MVEYKNLIVRKTWDDDNDFNKKRPESIKVRIWQYNYSDESRTQEILDSDGNSTKMIYRKLDGVNSDGFIEISKNTGDNNIWEYIALNLPAASESLPKNDETDKKSKIYYSYRIEEISVDGYITSISYNISDTEFLISITNSIKSNLLPNTGGQGVMIFIFAGLGVFLFALYRFIRVKLKYYIEYIN